ncbi:MAG TPA: CDP-alcohol phosphatidyltransferase family protein [Gemmatimonadales bacterium]|jgi:phosphatidylglycerophosphate synthase
METAKRELTFLLAEPERRLLRWLAVRIPSAVTSDHLTALGLAGAALTGLAYALSRRGPGWLWVACAGLLINWFGDSLDGTLARVRRVERPRYGYYLDHAADVFTTLLIGVGIGASPYVSMAAALGLVAAYLGLAINIYLESQVFGVFRLSYGRLGPTEARLLLVAGNATLALGTRRLWVPGQVTPVASAVAVALAAAMTSLLLWRVTRNVALLGHLEPLQRVARAVRPKQAA